MEMMGLPVLLPTALELAKLLHFPFRSTVVQNTPSWRGYGNIMCAGNEIM
jgi:hypothetical protein